MEARPTDRSHAQAGIVSGLWRYPVKSMAGEALASADISWAGLAGDRRWAFVRPDSQGSGFPWHTIREFPEMSKYVALLGEPARPDRSRVLVRTPDVVVTLDSGAPFEEDEWVGSAVRIGAAVVRMDRRDSRCIIVNVDPASGLPDSHLLKVIGTTRGACAGVYGTTVLPGLIRVGDPVVVEMRPQVVSVQRVPTGPS